VRALAKDPTQRFQGMEEMAAALSATLPAPPATTSAPRRASPAPIKRNLSLRNLLAAALVAVPAALGLGFLVARHSAGAAEHATNGSGSLLIVMSSPDGVGVVVDGQRLAQATPTVVHDLPAGRHTVRLVKSGLAAVERRVDIGAQERAVINVVLPPSSHRVEVRSSPPGASLYLDGGLVPGETPTTVDVSDDDFHELRFEKDGFETQSASVVPGDSQKEVHVELVREKGQYGTLLVDSNESVDVWLDGRNSGFTTPTIGMRVPVGKHLVEVHDGGGGSASSRISVGQGQTVRLNLTPRRAR